MSRHTLTRLSFALFLFSWLVIAMGAWTRLNNAGLSCPDWPFCYGHIGAPQHMDAAGLYHVAQGWYEMAHRYVAGLLVLGILFLSIGIFRFDKMHRVSRWATSIMLLVLCYQPWLGAMTVIDKLYPAIVSQHLLCGFSLMALLWYHYAALSQDQVVTLNRDTAFLPHLWLIALFALAVQIALGVWTSTNYAAIACPNFPICSLHSWSFQWGDALHLSRHLGSLDAHPILLEAVRRSIQVMHRFGAFFIGSFLLVVQAITIMKRPSLRLLRFASVSLVLLLFQIVLGVMNALYARPLFFAMAHNLTAAALLWSVVAVLCAFSRHRIEQSRGVLG